MNRLVGPAVAQRPGRVVRRMFGIALTVGILLNGTTALAGNPAISSASVPGLAAAAPSIGIFRMADPEVLNGYAKVVYYLRNVPPGADIQLERTFSTANSWGIVGRVPASNDVGLTAIFRTPPIGAFHARLVVRLSGRVLAISPAVLFRVYAALSAETIYRRASQIATVGDIKFKYIESAAYAETDTLTLNHTTCRSVTLLGINSDDLNVAHISVVQANNDEYVLDLPPQVLVSAYVPLKGNSVDIFLAPTYYRYDFYTMYYYAYFSCYSLTGQ